MHNAALGRQDHPGEIGRDGLTSSETAKYTQDLLDSLRKIASRQKQDMLARLLEAAALEAARLAGKEISPD